MSMDFFVDRGTLNPDAPSYIERQADKDLLKHVLNGEFCYVLTSRQMGKSSLMARTAARLKEQGVRPVILDLSALGGDKNSDENRWYCGLADEVLKQLHIDIDLGQWWQKRQHLPAIKRLHDFFQEVVLAPANGPGPVVIFVDEIDTTLDLPFTDDFFAAIRACYNARAGQPTFRQLTFVLLGVASPSDLIKDSRRTPFNIGTRIELTDFTLAEAAPLAAGLKAGKDRGLAVLKRILYWTGGHPYLTQKLCKLAAQENSGAYSDNFIDGLVDSYFIAPGTVNSEDNIQFIIKRLTGNKQRRRPLLRLYRRIRKGKPVLDNPLSPSHNQIKLSGVAAPKKDRHLDVRNRVYQDVFTLKWVREAMPIDWTRNIMVAAFLISIVSTAYWYWGKFPHQYIDAIQIAENDVPQAAFQKLEKIFFYRAKANELMAAYWERRAVRAEFAGDGDPAILYRIQALTIHDTPHRRSLTGLLTGVRYKNLRVTFPPGSNVNAAAFSPDGKYIVTGSDDGTVQVWDRQTGRPLRFPMEQYSTVKAAAFSPNGKYIVAGSYETAQVWNWQSGKPLGPPMKHNDRVTAVAFSPDGKYVLTGSDDGIAQVWDGQAGEPVGPAMKHDDSVNAATFSPDGRYVVTGSWDKTAQVWYWQSGKPVGPAMKHEDAVYAVSFSPDGKYVLTGSGDGTAQVWDRQTGNPKGPAMKHGSSVYAAAFSPDGRYMVTGSGDLLDNEGTAQVWDWQSGNPLGTPMKHDDRINAASFSPDGRYVVTGSRDGTAQVWERTTSQPPEWVMKHDPWIDTAAFSLDGRYVVTGSRDGTAQVWDGQSGKPVGTPMKHSDWVNAAAFSPDGKYIVTGGEYGTTQVWDWQTGKPLGLPIKHGDWVNAAAFSPDGKYVVTGSRDDNNGTAQVWEWQTGKPQGPPMKQDSPVSAAAFSPDGRYVVTGSLDILNRKGTAQVWDCQSGKPQGPPMNHYYGIRSAAFSPDGRSVITATRDWIYRWAFSSQGLTPVAARPLPYRFAGGIQFVDRAGTSVRVTLHYTGDTITLSTIRFDIPDATPIQGTPAELMREWQFKLGLVLDPTTGDIKNK